MATVVRLTNTATANDYLVTVVDHRQEMVMLLVLSLFIWWSGTTGSDIVARYAVGPKEALYIKKHNTCVFASNAAVKEVHK